MAEVLALSIVIFLFSVIIHEVSHGLVARYFGDHTAEAAGRLTLNPLPHIDPFGSVILPLLLIITGSPILLGWAKPVPVNPLHFKNIRLGELWVSFAGPLSNLILAVIAAALFHIIPGFSLIDVVLQYAVRINMLLAIFNLLPIPPLDGSKMLMSYLPLDLMRSYERLTPYGFLLILMLWYIPIGNTSVLGLIMRFALNIAHAILGV